MLDIPETLLVISANLGGFDKPQPDEPQRLFKNIVNIDTHRTTDEEFPLRDKSLSPRLQARIVKMFAWQMYPGYDYYLWVDSSCRLRRADSVKWFYRELGDRDVAVFKHPNRQTIQQEADYLKHRLRIKCPYITPRYENELIDEQLAEVDPSDILLASTAFIYRNTPKVHRVMKEWWYHTSRFHSIDQLSLSYALRGTSVNIIEENYLKTEYLEYVR